MRLVSTIIFRVILIGIFLWSCGERHAHNENSHDQYTCSMHPQVIQDHPGTCPICGMELVLVSKSSSQVISLNDNQIELGNIKTEHVKVQSVGQAYVTNGRLVTDESLTQKISSTGPGRIVRLLIKETGTITTKGSPLYEIFSEELSTLQREYLMALEQTEALGPDEPRFAKILQAAEKKLTLYGMSADQLKRLKTNRKINEYVTFYSTVSGYVSNVNVTEGQYIEEGQALFEIQNYGNLWVESELYPSETALVKTGDQIKVRIAGFESSPEYAVVSFLSPELRSNTQINTMRAVLKNPEGKFKPGMQAQVMFTASAQKALAVPTDAVIRGARGSHLFVKTKVNTFTPREVTTGSENVDFIEITSGLKEGEEVVTSGAYLLYSEMVLKKGTDLLKYDH